MHTIQIEEIPVEHIEDFWNIHIQYLLDDGIITDEEDVQYFQSAEYRDVVKAHMIRPVDKHHMIYFLRDDIRIGAAQYNTYQSEDGKCFVLDFWVFPKYRGNGTGHQCFEALKTYTMADGARYYELNYTKENAQQFWQSLGFVDCGKDEYEMPFMQLHPVFMQPMTREMCHEFYKDFQTTMKGKMITLEPLDVQKHAKGYFEVCQDENIHKYTGNTVPQCVDETIMLLKKYQKYFFNWMIISNDSMTVIGIIRLGKPEMENGILIAGESQFLLSSYWRKGHMKEAKKLFYQYVFEKLSVGMLCADVWEGNVNSIKSLESYGYKLIETKKEIFSKTGKYALKYIYSLSKNDYLHNREKE